MNNFPHRAWVGLGSNLTGPLGEPVDYLEAALRRLEGSKGLRLLHTSGFYRTAPWGKRDQAPFVNAVAEFDSSLSALELLDTLLIVERGLGRERKDKWGPRLVDLDLLCFDDLQIHSKRLVLPHPHMHERAFVLVPLLELDPDFVIPGKGRADDCLEAADKDQAVELL